MTPQLISTKISCRYCRDPVQAMVRTDPRLTPLCRTCVERREKVYRPEPMRKERAA